ncbi:unnamed protein product [Closterium sp. NIES-64]|nr:unnamed protein product [Closterium sp. NIES-64]
MNLRALTNYSSARAASQTAAFTTSAAAAAAASEGVTAAAVSAAATAAAGTGAGGAKGGASAAASRSKTHWARLAGATLVGSTMTAGVLLSTQDPQTISKWSFAAADALTPFLRLLDPEAAHRLALLSAELSLVPHEHRPDPPALCIALWNRAFPNPVGLAAGFDKDGRAVDGLLGMGFGFMEIGSVTPAPQPGNPKPRGGVVISRDLFNSDSIAATLMVLLRLRILKSTINAADLFNSDGIAAVADFRDFLEAPLLSPPPPLFSSSPSPASPPSPSPPPRAVINRYGFNSEGIAAVAERLGAQQGRRRAVEKPEGLKTGKDRAAAPPAAGGNAGRRGLVGVNLGKNKWTDDAAEDFVQGMHTLAQYADFLVVNVSSPNTPGLRKLQGRRHLHGLLTKVLAAREEMQWGEEGPPPLLLKISPDLSHQDMADIAAVSSETLIPGPHDMAHPKLDLPAPHRTSHSRTWPALPLSVAAASPLTFRLPLPPSPSLFPFPLPPSPFPLPFPLPFSFLFHAALSLSPPACNSFVSTPDPFLLLACPPDPFTREQIVGNTTVSRPDSVLGLLHADEPGGLSGRPLFDPSTNTLREMYRLTKGRITLIGCGGIFSGADAYTKIRAGASLVQIYTAMVYEGAGVLPRIKRELAECLARDGFESVEDAVGADHRAAAALHMHA